MTLFQRIEQKKVVVVVFMGYRKLASDSRAKPVNVQVAVLSMRTVLASYIQYNSHTTVL